MPLHNQISLKFSEKEAETIKQALDVLEDKLLSRMVNLTPQERQKKYSLPNRNKVTWLDKILIHMEQKPDLTPVFIDTEEFRKDITSFLLLREFKSKLDRLSEGVEDTSAVLWNDIYRVALTYYKHVVLASNSDVPGSTSIQKDLSTLFERRKKTKKSNAKKDRSDDSGVNTP